MHYLLWNENTKKPVFNYIRNDCSSSNTQCKLVTVCRIRMVARLILPGFLPWFINIITLKQVTQFLYCRMILKAILYVVYLQQNVRELKIVFSNWYCKSNVSILCLKRREKNWKATDLFFTTFWNTFCFKVKKVFFVRNCIFI